jgi:hypothetical protein
MNEPLPRTDEGDASASVERLLCLGRRLGVVLPWHLGIFIALNVALTLANIVTGRPWWAVWPLIISSFVLALHYFLYRATAVDDAWVESRITELNLRSYDRSHIEDIKERAEREGYGQPRDDRG